MAERPRLRIGLVVPRYLPHLGGIENHVAALASHLADRGHTVTVATQLEADTFLPRREVDAHGVVVRRFPSAGRLRGQGLSPALWAWVRRGADRAQVLHLHNLHALTILPTLAAASSPVVFTPHYLGPGEGRVEELLHRGYVAGLRRVLPRVRRVVCTTPSEAALFARQVGAGDRCVVVPNGVDAAAIAAADPLPGGPGRLVVTAGRLEEYKQPQRVLEALPLLPPGYRLAVVGTGPLAAPLRRRARELGVADRVTFPGRLPPSELYRWYRAAHVVVTLSRRECFGLTVAEGLAAGAAVVASDIGPHRDVVTLAGAPPAGLVAVDAAPEQVAAAIAAARRPPRVALPDWDDVAAAVEACYGEVT